MAGICRPIIAELTVGFQFSDYMMIEDNGDQTVCLTVMSGMLAPGVFVMANLATLTGNSMYYVIVNTEGGPYSTRRS